MGCATSHDVAAVVVTPHPQQQLQSTPHHQQQNRAADYATHENNTSAPGSRAAYRRSSVTSSNSSNIGAAAASTAAGTSTAVNAPMPPLLFPMTPTKSSPTVAVVSSSFSQRDTTTATATNNDRASLSSSSSATWCGSFSAAASSACRPPSAPSQHRRGHSIAELNLTPLPSPQQQHHDTQAVEPNGTLPERLGRAMFSVLPPSALRSNADTAADTRTSQQAQLLPSVFSSSGGGDVRGAAEPWVRMPQTSPVPDMLAVDDAAATHDTKLPSSQAMVSVRLPSSLLQLEEGRAVM